MTPVLQMRKLRGKEIKQVTSVSEQEVSRAQGGNFHLQTPNRTIFSPRASHILSTEDNRGESAY